MKAKPYSEFIWVVKYLLDHLLTRGIKPSYTRIDNGSYTSIQRELKSKDINFQLSPPGMHRHNTAECVIITFK